MVELRVPPLRERRDDILPLARAVPRARGASDCERAVARLHAARRRSSSLRYDWPGNVRELENAIERAVVLADGARIDADDLPEEVRAGAARRRRRRAGCARSRTWSATTSSPCCKSTGGNKTKAAAQLRIGTATLFRKLKLYSRKRS